MSFLPTDYEPPKTGNYMKLDPGQNRFRVLAPAIIGNVFWTGDNGDRKPVRRRMSEVIQESELGVDQFGKRERARHFWAFPVWNYAASSVQILEVTQATVQEAIQQLCASPDWGDPMGYDLVVNKTGTGMDTKYSVMPSKPSSTDPAILESFRQANVNLDALYAGEDPFGGAASNGSAAPEGVSSSVPGVRTPPPAAASPPPAAVSATKEDAWAAFCTGRGNLDGDALNAAWGKLLAEAVPGKAEADYSPADWHAVLIKAGDDIPF